MINDILLTDDTGAESLGEEGRFGRIVTGAERVAQNVIFTLLNNTNFSEDILNCPTSYDVALLFGMCSDQTRQIISEQDTKAGYTSSDKLKTIELEKVSYSDSNVVVYLNITTDAGAIANDAVVINYISEPSDY